MKNSLVLALATIAATIAPAGLTAAPETADLAVGAGQFTDVSTGGVFRFSFNAQGQMDFNDQSLRPARGRAVISFGDVTVKGTIDCMKGAFHSGFVEGTLDEPVELGGLVYPDFLIQFADNGEPDVLADFAAVHLDANSAPCDASANMPTWANFLSHGNITVINRDPQ